MARSSDLNRARRLGRAAGAEGREYACYFSKSHLRVAFWRAWEPAFKARKTVVTIYVWHESQKVPAKVYADANCPGARIVVSTDPTITTNMEAGVVRYHFA